MTSWAEKYRPKTLSDYIIANWDKLDISVNYLNSVIDNNPIFNGLLFVGQPGTGKTTFANVLQKRFKAQLHFVYINASDERRKDDMMSMIQKGHARTLNRRGKWRRTILVLDEAEKMPYLNDVIKYTKGLIVIVNNKWDLDNNIRNQLTEIQFRLPSNKLKEDYAKKILRQEAVELSYAKIDEVVSKSLSYRDVALNLQLTALTGEVIVIEQDEYDMFTEIHRQFRGLPVGNAKVQPRELLEWALDNGGHPALISRLDKIMGKSTDYRSWKYVYKLISKCGAGNKRIKYPQSWKTRFKIKNQVEKEKSQPKKKETKKATTKPKIKTRSFFDF